MVEVWRLRVRRPEVDGYLGGGDFPAPWICHTMKLAIHRSSLAR